MAKGGKRRGLRLIIAAGALVVLVGGYFIVKAVAAAEKPKPGSNVIKVANLKQDDVQSVELKTADSTLVLDRKGGKLEPQLPYPMAIDQSAVQRILGNVTNIYAQRVVVDEAAAKAQAPDLAKFGLAHPQAVVTVKLKKGEPVVYHVGDRTPSKGDYYFQRVGDPRIVTLDSFSAKSMMLTLTDLRDHSLPSIDDKKLVYLRIDNGKQNIEMTKAPKDFNAPESSFATMAMTSPYKKVRPVATDQFAALLKKIPTFTVDTFVDDHPTNLDKYGLGAGHETLVMQDDKQTLHLLFGKSAGDGKVYAKLENKPSVFTLDTDLSFMTAFTAFDLVDKFVLIVNIDTVDKLTVTTPDATYTGTITRTGTGDKKKTSYTFQGKEVQEQYFKNFYQKAIAIFYDAENPSPHPGKPAYTISFTLNTNNNPTLTAEFVPFNSNFYQVYRNGLSEFVVSHDQLKHVAEAAALLAQGKDPGKD